MEVSAGFCVSYSIYTNFFQTYNIVDSDAKFAHLPKYQYLNDDQTIVLYDDEIKNLNKFLFGIKGVIRYNITIFDDFIISPEIGYYKPLSNVTTDSDWKINSTSFGINFFVKIN